jgi:hypothetical protein
MKLDRARRGSSVWVLLLSIGAASACGSEGSGADPRPRGPVDIDERDADRSPAIPTTPGGNAVQLSLAPAVLQPITSQLEQAQALDAEALIAARAVGFESALGHDPRQALGLPEIQTSPLALSEPELERLTENGFVILPRKEYPSFPYGYFDIYAADLPVYVTADMVLEAVHRSYDDILMNVELADLRPRLLRLLGAMRERLGSGEHTLEPQAAQDADLYLSVAQSLLSGQLAAPVTEVAAADVADIVRKAEAAQGASTVTLFGTERVVDFSQFEPRGHYTDVEALSRYFRAMMWLGRIDMRMLETLGTGERVFRRRQLEMALAFAALLDESSAHDWQVIDATIGAFVGEHDYMTLPELDTLLGALGTTRAAGLGDLPDEAVAQAIVDGRYGAQRIASHLIRKLPGAGETLPLNASFAFFGQRYTVDSHVFSNVVFDRVQTRVLPNPLDAAFAALGNDHAVSLLASELSERPYAGALGSMRTLVDAHPSEYWQGSLYTSWLSALRTLSPAAAAPAADGLPAVARREPWARRILNTQLASWAQLRHDTILYAKQSYTAGSSCEFPDAYVEPYPEFFRAIQRLAERGAGMLEQLELTGEAAGLGSAIGAYFDTLGRINGSLAEMAELQRTGLPHSPEHVAFINQAIRVEGGASGAPWQTGWYKDLFFDQEGALDLDPTIADVHTDPGGDTPFARGPSVLHVGTGLPRAMVVSVDTCDGPRAYAGVVFAYHEHTEPALSRLTDEEWLERLFQQPAAEVPWLEPVLPAP